MKAGRREGREAFLGCVLRLVVQTIRCVKGWPKGKGVSLPGFALQGGSWQQGSRRRGCPIVPEILVPGFQGLLSALSVWGCHTAHHLDHVVVPSIIVKC